MTYYAGLDVSQRSTHVCIIDDDSELLVEGKTDSEVADIIAFLDELDVEIAEVRLEAGTLTVTPAGSQCQVGAVPPLPGTSKPSPLPRQG